MNIQEVFVPRRIAANGTLNMTGMSKLGGFVCEVAGTLTLTIDNALVVAIPVAAGVFHPLPFALAGICTIVLSGGAVGAACII